MTMSLLFLYRMLFLIHPFEQLFGLVQFTVKWFFIAVIVYSLFDLAANSKLVAAPNVHMAETSDKTFDDVVGVDEVRKI